MVNDYLVLGATLLLLLAAILVYFRVANRFNIIDKPNERSSHKRITLRGGGVVFFFGVVLYMLFYGFEYPLFFIGLVAIAVVSFLDDVVTVNSRYRIVVHFVAMFLMFYDCGFYSLPWYYTLFALIVSTGIINAYNFMDGINGITGGYSLVVVASFWAINNYRFSFVDNNLLYVVGLSILVFNFFNFRRRARCFAGDVGSVSIAFIVVFLLGKLMVESGDFSYIIVLLLYGVDSVLTIVHRLMLRENIFEAHRKHFYQIMSNELQIPHTTVSLLYMGTQTAIMAGYLLLPVQPLPYLLSATVIMSIIYVAFMNKYFRLHVGK
ncbi:MAG: glycosyltransferase family 4 protein [Bacteroidales bacterium]|nr:glycosyltransferase family 4 protein [Bacteroidales bacterium]